MDRVLEKLASGERVEMVVMGDSGGPIWPDGGRALDHPCPTYWRSHGCDLPMGHGGEHVCGPCPGDCNALADEDWAAGHMAEQCGSCSVHCGDRPAPGDRLYEVTRENSREHNERIHADPVRPRRVVKGELRETEMDAEWIDTDGDRWRYREPFWECLDDDGAWEAMTPDVGYAPFTERTEGTHQLT